MSYEKAMKHATNPNLRKGRGQYMGFDTGRKAVETDRYDVLNLFKCSCEDGDKIYELEKMANELDLKLSKNYTVCACGEKYDPVSYEAGWLDACGKCPSCCIPDEVKKNATNT